MADLQGHGKEHLVATLTHIMPKPCFKYSYPLFFRLSYFCKTKPPNWVFAITVTGQHCSSAKHEVKSIEFILGSSLLLATSAPPEKAGGRKKNKPSCLKKAVLQLERRNIFQELEGANKYRLLPSGWSFTRRINSCKNHSKLFRHVNWEKRTNQTIQTTIKIKGFF